LVKPVDHANAPKQVSRRAASAPKPGETKEAVGVDASNGKDRRRTEDEFGEF